MSDNRYEVLGKIADGGLGSVYKAYDRNLRREVALKRVRAETAEETLIRAEELMNEARNLSTLQHPHIVSIYDVGRDDEGAYLVMELLRGETLEDIIERGALNEIDFRELVTQSLEGMIAAHTAGMIHLDVKPQNFMVIWLPSGKFQIKILDFGLAQITNQPMVQEMDDDGAIMGSIYFMTPEQFERSPVDARTDLYSLGCVYYYSLTQNYPFQGETGPEVMASHMYHSHVPLEQLRPDLPVFIHRWVEWLMCRLPDDRPADATVAYESFLKGSFPAPPEAHADEVLTAVPSDDQGESVPSAIPDDDEPVPAPVQHIARPGIPSGQSRPAAPRPAAPHPTAPRPTRPVPALTSPVSVPRPAGSASQQLASRPVPKPAVRPIVIAAAAAPKHLVARKPMPKWATVWLPLSFFTIVALVLFIQSRMEASRSARLQTLAQQEKPQGLYSDGPMLLAMLEDRSKSEQAGKVLGKLQGLDSIDNMLKSYLPKAKSDFARKNLVIAIGARGVREAAPELVSLLGSSKTPEVRVATWNALGRTGQSSNIPEMLGKMAEASEDELRAAEQAVAAVARREPDAEKRSQPIVHASKANPASDDLAAALLRILGKLGGSAGYDELSAKLKSTNIKVRTAAVVAFAEWPTGEALPNLLALLTTEKSPGVRSNIISTIGKLASRASNLTQADIATALGAAYAATKDNREQQDIISALGRVMDPASVAILNDTIAKDPIRKRSAESEAKNVIKLLERVITVADGTPLDIEKAELTGPLIRTGGTIINWPGLGDNVSWALKIIQPGTYEVKLAQSFHTANPGRYIVAIGRDQLKNRVEKTTSATDYKTVTVGKVSLEKPGIYHLWIIPQEIAPGESLMRLKEVILTKTGG
jgi:serine/threonine protein kinase/HEAT repeat protein